MEQELRRIIGQPGSFGGDALLERDAAVGDGSCRRMASKKLEVSAHPLTLLHNSQNSCLECLKSVATTQNIYCAALCFSFYLPPRVLVPLPSCGCDLLGLCHLVMFMLEYKSSVPLL